MPKLIVSIDGVVIKDVTLAKDCTTLGRRPYNDIVIDNLAVSGEHAVLHLGGGDAYLEDLNSTNGTYINGRPIKKQAIGSNDVIEIGKYKIRYIAVAERADPKAVAAASSGPSRPMSLTAAATDQLPLGGKAGVAVIRVVSGAEAGSEISLQKVVTTVGKPGTAVAAITRRLRGYVVASVDGPATLNAKPLGSEAVALQDGDLLVLGDTRMQFTIA
jgi:hypothetical protein